MLGKTHMVVGMASGLFIMHPDTVSMVVVGAGTAAFGALLPDIDVGTSESHRDADIVIALSVIVVLALGIMEAVFHLGITSRLLAHDGWAEILIPAVIFLIVCAFGKEQPHRSFMHSLLAMAILSGCIFYLFPRLVYYFAIGFGSHLLTDMLNRKKVRILYPLPCGVALGLCHAHGTANRVLFIIGSIATVAGVAYCVIPTV